jgi:hypothetical protein
MSQDKNFTVIETYYHVRATIDGADSEQADYLFTKNQLEVAKARAEDKKHLLPPPPMPPAMSGLPSARKSFLKRWFSWVKK